MSWLVDGTKPWKTGGSWGWVAGRGGSKQHLSCCGDVTEDKCLHAAAVQKSLVQEAPSLYTRILS